MRIIMYDLNRFKKAQRTDYLIALEEVKTGRKTSHWIWYIFPQLKGLGFSGMSDYYGIEGLDEAKAYLEDSVLKSHLIEISEALLNTGGNDPSEIFGYPDDLKVHSCMTLFGIADPSVSVFRQVLDQFYGGKEERGTIRILKLRGEI